MQQMLGKKSNLIEQFLSRIVLMYVYGQPDMFMLKVPFSFNCFFVLFALHSHFPIASQVLTVHKVGGEANLFHCDQKVV